MTPVEQVAALYKDPQHFVRDLELHLLHGYVTSRPDIFVMGRAVDVHAPDNLIRDPSHKFPNPNGWMVYAYAGDVRSAIGCAPYFLPFCCYHRRGKLRVYPLSRFCK